MRSSGVPINELAEACSRSADAAEWEEFLERCAPVAALVASRVARLWTGAAPPAVVDDLVQDAFLKLCEQERRILREFQPHNEDSFLGLLRVVTASVANDYFRRMFSEKRGGKVVTLALDSEVSASAGRAQSAQRMVLFSEFDRILRSATGATAERDRTVFWLYYLQGLTAEEIAALPGLELTAKGVESSLRRMAAWLRNEIAPRTPAERHEPASETS
jgi:RNA polymerase sigma-70 factor, ECF subfamily